MPTRLRSFVAALAESGWLAALIAVPVFFNPLTARVFEADKVYVLRALAALIVAAGAAWAVESGTAWWRIGDRAAWRQPVVMAALAFTAVQCLAAGLGVAPELSFWGSYERVQGACTSLAYLGIVLAVVLLARARAQIERIVTAALVASVPVALYALAQAAGIDPLVWGGDAPGRVHGTAGNPVFLGGFMVMVVPLTVVRLLALGADARLPSRAHAWRAATYAGLLLVQVAAIVFAGSRGPVLALCLGLALSALVLWACRHAPGAVAAAAGAAALSVVLLLLAPDLSGESSRRDPEGVALPPRASRVRTLIWQGAAELLAADPLRAVIGYGPETMSVTFPRVFPPELGRRDPRRIVTDRAHNATFDVVLANGALGAAALLAVWIACFTTLFEALGLIATGRQRAAVAAALAVGAGAGAVVPYAVDGSLRFAGIGAPAGMIAAVFAVVLALATRPPRHGATPAGADAFLLAGLGGALMAHFAEIQTGIATGTTQLYFWVYAAALGALAGRTTVDRAGPRPSTDDGFAFAVLVGLMLVLFTADFVPDDPDWGATGALLAALLAASWAATALVHGAAAPASSGVAGAVWRTATISAAVGSLCAVAYLVSFGSVAEPDHTPEAGLEHAWEIADGVTILYGIVFALTAIAALGLMRDERTARPVPRWRSVGALLAGAGLVLAVTRAGLRASRADVLRAQAAVSEQRGYTEVARTLYRGAVAFDPGEPQYAAALARLLAEDARRAPAGGEALLEEAHGVLEALRARRPLDPEPPRELGRLHRLWAGLAVDARARAQHLATAKASYAAAVALSPRQTAIRNEWAALSLQFQEPHTAIDQLGRSLQLDAQHAPTYVLRGRASLDAGQPADALRDFERAATLRPDLPTAWQGQATALDRLGRLPEAIAAYQRLLARFPDDVAARRELAALYRRAGARDRAIAELQEALRLAPAWERPALTALIEQIAAEERRADPVRTTPRQP